MRLTKKVIALLLCALMVATVLPVGVFAADELLTSEYDVNLDFQTSSWVNSYFTERAAGSNLQFLGNADSNGTFWSTYVTEEDGNKYLYQVNPTNQGYTFANVEGYDNFSKAFQLSFRMKLESHSNTLTTGLYIPVLRGSIGTTASANTSGTGTANILAVANTATYPGEAAVEGEKNLIGYLIPGTGNSTGYTHTGYGIYSDTWYDIVFMADKATGKCWFSVTDGANEYELAYEHATMKGLSILNKMMLFRTYQTAQGAKVSLDDVRLTNIKRNFKVEANMNGLPYATGTNADTGAAETYAYSSMTPTMPGFTSDGSANAAWNLVAETEGGVTNKYISHIEGAAASPITFTDTVDLLDVGSFSYSFDIRRDGGNQVGGLLSVKVADMGYVSEFRIINMIGDGSLIFGPSSDTTFKIAQLTTSASEGGAQWHNIKTVFKPFVEADYVDMCYEFYMDGKLVAYTDVVTVEGNYSYNLYTKASGEWKVIADLQPAKVQKYMDGETETYKWVGVDESIDASCSWGSDANNIYRLPLGYWDGYAVVDVDGNEAMENQDGVIANMASIYMFHWNQAGFSLDNLKLDFLTDDAIESAEIVGYQINDAKDSVRFITCVDSQDFGQVGVDVQVFDATADMTTPDTVEPLWITKVNNKMTNTVCTAITADGEQVGAMEEFGARFFTMLTVEDINSSATVRLRPYTTKDSVRTYGAPVDYIITYKNGEVSVEKAPYLSADYSDGLDTSGAANGYAYTSWAGYTWDTLANPVADIGWGGESNSRTAALQDDGSIKINTNLAFKAAKKITKTVPVLDEEGNPTYDEEGNPVTETVDVKDNDGKQLYSDSSFSRRIKFAYVIPTNLEDYKGYTFVITAKIKATEINVETMKEVTVGEGEDAEVYNAALDLADEDGQCGLAFGFMTDYNTGAIRANNYIIKNDGEWIEVQAAIEINDALLAHAYVAPKTADLAPVTDGEGTVHPAPLRPFINLSGVDVDDGYLRECYVKDLNLMIVPTPGYVAAE